MAQYALIIAVVDGQDFAARPHLPRQRQPARRCGANQQTTTGNARFALLQRCISIVIKGPFV
jgi:hypothetical protein